MDDLYSNLENYDEVNALEELKTENNELKAKLDDYAVNMDKLQKDFDKLASEFKTLEFNYSSLLKTARAEIERKTQIITNINIEKDTLILNSLQNGNKNILRRNMTNKPLPVKKDWKEKDSSHLVKNTKEKKDSWNMKTIETPSDRKVKSHTSSENEIASLNTNKLTNNVSKIMSKVESCKDGNSDSKEKMHHIVVKKTNEEVKQQPHNIKNRRKSIPVASVRYEKCSSDEDSHSPARESTKNVYAKDKHNKNLLDKSFNINYRAKMSESSSIEDRTSGYHQSSRQSFKSRTNRYIENDKWKSRDKYNTSRRHKRHLSPEKLYQKPHREHSDDHSYRPNYDKGRNIRSPPSDRFQHFQHRNREYNLNYERNNTCVKERYTYRQDRHPIKHKIPNDYDEPYCKRQKTDLYNTHREDDTAWYDNMEHVDIQSNEDTMEHLQELQEQYTTCASPDNLQYTSCLSPDHVTTDISSEPKEIMDTAVVQLEDPRVLSNKYCIVKTDDAKVALSTIVGRNVDMKVMDRSVWGVNKVTVPEALVQPPVEDTLIQEIYMDIDNPVLNVPVETGKDIGVINFDSEYISAENDAVTPEKILDVTDIHESLKGSTSITKQKQWDRDTEHQSVSHDKSVKSLGVIEDFHPTNDYKNSYNGNTKNGEGDSLINMTEKHDNIIISKNEGDADNKIHEWLHNNKQQHSNPISTTEIVEGDLELSDETCDHTEIPIQHFECNIENKALSLPKQNHITLHTTESYIPEHNNDTTPKICVQVQSDNASNVINDKLKLEKIIIKTKCEDHSPDIIKVKGKKQKEKVSKSKDMSNIICESSNSTDKIVTKDKKTKPKKERPKQIKTKFRDLFGDSSSLITPEDLGLPATLKQTEIQSTNNYTPVFEDAVDANDIKEITRVNPLALDNVNQDTTPSLKIDNKTIPESSKSTKTSKESKKKKIKKPDDPKDVSSDVVPTVKTNQEDLNIEAVTKETDVVKTVVISTGVQPQLISEREVDILTKAAAVAESLQSVNDDQKDTLINRDMLIAALATSTPQKDPYPQTSQLVLDSRMLESSCTSNDSPAASVDNVTPVANVSDTLDSQTEIDPPDVRIFVRRKRKVIKRPPVT